MRTVLWLTRGEQDTGLDAKRMGNCRYIGDAGVDRRCFNPLEVPKVDRGLFGQLCLRAAQVDPQPSDVRRNVRERRAEQVVIHTPAIARGGSTKNGRSAAFS